MAAFLRPQVWESRLGNQQRTEEVGLHLGMSFGIADLFDHAEESVAGVVDNHVESPGVRVGRIDRGNRRGMVRDVEASRRIRSPYRSEVSLRLSILRAVTATLSPRSSAAMAHRRPKPRDVPVLNHTFEAWEIPFFIRE